MLSPAIAEIVNGSFRQKEPPAIIGSGFVVRSIEAALWAFHRSDSFREGALRAVNLGNDADTAGAIYGQLAGAFYGVNGIPRHWLARLAMRELIGEKTDALFEFSDRTVIQKADLRFRSRAEGGDRSERGRFIDICEGRRSELGRYI
jgi:ADP-ribosyl-[dinitrogen reductase] hydrolase